MTITFNIKQGDLLPLVRGQFTDPVTGVPLTLTTYTLRFLMRRADSGAVVIDRAADVDTDPTYFVFPWADGDTDTAGTYEAEVRATKAGKPLTVPTSLPMIVEIYPAIVP